MSRDETIVFAFPSSDGHGVSHIPPDVGACVLQNDNLDKVTCSFQSLSQYFKDSAGGNNVRWPSLIDSFETSI
ncbi:hypothetical protein PCH70_29040 [Pseudomonas cichorii JBC1]|nr:hypothetical protein PCH70_29040 [Pseudomonas cichorii JBC1]